VARRYRSPNQPRFDRGVFDRLQLSRLAWEKFGLSAMAAAHLCKRNEIEVRYAELRDENRRPFIHNVHRKKFIEAVKRRLLALEPNINQAALLALRVQAQKSGLGGWVSSTER
jgi:hypothetical protein